MIMTTTPEKGRDRVSGLRTNRNRRLNRYLEMVSLQQWLQGQKLVRPISLSFHRAENIYNKIVEGEKLTDTVMAG